MDEQVVQMGGITEGLNDIEYNIQRARTTAKTIARDAVHDRCIQVLCGGIILCVLIIIVLFATGQNK